MRLIKMTGGLGNQMFIYAFYLRMKKRYPEVRIDLSDMVHYKVHYGYEMNRVFRLPHTEFCINQPLKKVVEFLFFKKIYERKQDPHSLRAFEKEYFWPLLYFKGFYQSERFFADMKEEVRKAFTFDLRNANEQSLRMMQRMDADANAVSLHVRRGDYLQPQHWATTGSVCGLPYYRNAIAEMNKRVARPAYYVFSDDMAWVKENLPLENAVYIDWNKGEESWQDMMLMSHCKHHIICNSTFSWWGAWLNPSADKIVLVPTRWFQHCDTPNIYPAGWTKVAID
ncbi:MAG: alpha-1,2-fucosyltransferase [Bacteroides sp.]|nr:alpha-1,2-fucosyltransferase [Bacteroides sp.]